MTRIVALVAAVALAGCSSLMLPNDKQIKAIVNGPNTACLQVTNPMYGSLTYFNAGSISGSFELTCGPGGFGSKTPTGVAPVTIPISVQPQFRLEHPTMAPPPR